IQPVVDCRLHTRGALCRRIPKNRPGTFQYAARHGPWPAAGQDIPDRASGRLQRSHACRHAQRCRNGAGTRRHPAQERASCHRAALLDRDVQTDARDSVITSKEPAMKRAFVKLTLPIVLVFALPIALGAQSNAMRIYWIDAEGGAATLFVAP